MASQQQDISVILISPEASSNEINDAAVPPSEADTQSMTGEFKAVTVAQLRSRVEQQSSLISMLKQRSDETFRELSQCRVQCDRETARNRELQETLVEVTKIKSTLEQRFQTLSYNHDELTRIMEEHKTQNRQLQEENNQLRTKNNEFFSEDLRKKNEQILTLRELISKGEERVGVLEGRCRVLEGEVKEHEMGAREKEKIHEEDLSREQKDRRVLELKLKDAESRVKTTENDILQLREKNKDLLVLSKHKDDDIKFKSIEMEKLNSDVCRLQKESQSLHEEFGRLSVELDRDRQVCVLKEQLKQEKERLEALRKEYLAYQKHSSDLLQKERELNTKLRHMSDL